MQAKIYTITMTTDGAGAGTAYSSGPIEGPIYDIVYDKTDFADGSVMTFTGEITGKAILAETGINADATRCPRAATCTVAGVAAVYIGAGQAVNDLIVLGGERVKLVVTGGGATKSGVWYITAE